MAKFELHISDIKAFKQCRRKWHWSSQLPGRMGLERIVTYAPFFTGKAVHHAMQHRYENGEEMTSSAQVFIDKEKKAMTAGGDLWESEEATVQEQTDLVMGMLEHYQSWASRNKEPYNDSELRFLSLETSFHVPLRTPSGRASNKVELGGRFDGVVEHISSGTYWIFETKTTRSIKELISSLANDEQAGTYVYAAQDLLKVHISGVLYNILRKKVPTEPQVLKSSGYLSQRADADTTAQAFVDFACKHHSDWTRDEVLTHYQTYVDMLLEKGNTFFVRHAVHRTPEEIKQLQKDLWAVSLEMTNPKVPLYPNPSWLNCGFCSFRTPCLMMNAGGDYESILEEEYRPRRPWDDAEEEEAPRETH
jgi:hypothetical protein